MGLYRFSNWEVGSFIIEAPCMLFAKEIAKEKGWNYGIYEDITEEEEPQDAD